MLSGTLPHLCKERYLNHSAHTLSIQERLLSRLTAVCLKVKYWMKQIGLIWTENCHQMTRLYTVELDCSSKMSSRVVRTVYQIRSHKDFAISIKSSDYSLSFSSVEILKNLLSPIFYCFVL